MQKIILYHLRGGLPQEKSNNFDINYPYCDSCHRSETFCQCKGFNSCLATIKKGLEPIEVDGGKIKNIIFKIAEKHFAPITVGYKIDLAHAIFEYLRGAK